jgi:pimeloyl-ACP methyl ester carboxylesterase
VWADVTEALSLAHAVRPWFTGHSLGGALATLAADRHGDSAAVYTFGSPLVGDDAFAAGFNNRHEGRSFRYVNGDDLVTRVPPFFTHINREHRLAAPPETSLWPGALIDHTPRRYSTLVWNSLAAGVL